MNWRALSISLGILLIIIGTSGLMFYYSVYIFPAAFFFAGWWALYTMVNEKIGKEQND